MSLKLFLVDFDFDRGMEGVVDLAGGVKLVGSIGEKVAVGPPICPLKLTRLGIDVVHVSLAQAPN